MRQHVKAIRRMARWIALGLMGGAGAALAAGEQFIPISSPRIGQMSAIGTGLSGGYIDYIELVNQRDGGVGGVKLAWEECETEYKVDRGVECYERLKKKGSTGASVFNHIHTGTTYATIERSVADKVPLVSIGYGRTDAADGRVFPFTFPLLATYWSQNTAQVKFIGMREGGMDKLKGKKIAHVYHDSPFGKETINIMNLQAKKYGFEVIHVGITPPGTEQQSQWLQVRQAKPDWVIMVAAGVMTPVALKSAQKVGYPVDRIVSGWWSGAEEDTIPAGDAAQGFITSSHTPTGTQFPVIQELIKRFYSQGKKGNMEDVKRVGSAYYNIGVIHGILNIEGIRVAQGKYGKKPLTGEQVRWGLEHLSIDEKRLKQLGALGLLQPLKTSCMDHEGGGAVKFSQWDGKKWNTITDWVSSDQSIVRPLIEESAAKYAKEKNIKLRDCSKES